MSLEALPVEPETMGSGPFTFGPEFDIDAALTPLPWPLEARWAVEDLTQKLDGLIGAHQQFHGSLLQIILVLFVFGAGALYAYVKAARARDRLAAELDAVVDAVNEDYDRRLDDMVEARDALRQRRYGEALYQADRAVEGYA